MYNLKGKAVLVTGAGGIGVGRGVCDAVSEAGGRLIINDLDEQIAREAASRYADSVIACGDVSDPRSVDAIFAKIYDRVGAVHGLVNNAGIGLSKPFHTTTPEEFERLLAVDVRGVWLMSRKFVEQAIRENIQSAVVNISSCHAHCTVSMYASYAGAKGMVESFSRGLAVEYGERGIRCNAIAPGYVHAEQNYDLIRAWTDDPQKWVENFVKVQQAIPATIAPIDCGRMAAFLLSDFARSITGQVIRVDAGLTAMMVGREPH